MAKKAHGSHLHLGKQKEVCLFALFVIFNVETTKDSNLGSANPTKAHTYNKFTEISSRSLERDPPG